jgi:thiol-disulfide isomerase/thioredoxin
MVETKRLAAVAMTLLAVTACGTPSTFISGGTLVPVATANLVKTLGSIGMPRQIKTAKAATDFSFPTISGKGPAALNAYAGKVRLVTFFATWCPNCQHETPVLTAVQAARGSKGFQIIALSLDKDPAGVVPGYASKYATNFPIAGGTQPLWKQYGEGKGIPDSFLVDRQGQIVQEYLGEVTEAQLTKDVDALLARR